MVLLGVQHLAVVVVVPQLSLEELGQLHEHDPMLTLPVLPKPDIPGATKQILEPRREGEARGRAAEATTAPIQALLLDQQEAPADALWDFSEPADLAAWLEQHGS